MDLVFPDADVEEFVNQMSEALAANVGEFAPFVRRETEGDREGYVNPVVMIEPILDVWEANYLKDEPFPWAQMGMYVFIAWKREREKRNV